MSETSAPPSSYVGDSHSNMNQHLAELDFLSSKPISSSKADYINSVPLFTKDASVLLEEDSDELIFSFKSLLGAIIKQKALIPGFLKIPLNPEIYLNVSAPFSAVLTGVQGSGKSHSLSVLLESCFIDNPITGHVPAPLAGLGLHFGTTTQGRAAEVAYLSSLSSQFKAISSAPEVIVLVSPSNIDHMKRTYAPMRNVKVYPLQLAPTDLNSSRIVSLMGLDEGKVILYMDSILAVLRAQGLDNFDYKAFRLQVDRLQSEFSPQQKQGLKLRLNLLDSFVSTNIKTPSLKNYFKSGRLVLVDLSDPFLGEAAACTLFDILLGLFLESEPGCKGKIIALDEAHTFLSSSSSQKLIASLTAIIRLQRHLGIRTLISTQEPLCVPPAILDLCSFILAHRFSSPNWASHLDEHVSTGSGSKSSWFEEVSELGVGEACLFAPSMLGRREVGEEEDDENEGSREKVARFGRGYLKISIRSRLTEDGGTSILAV